MASSDIGIDLGTASILVYVKGKGVVLKEPSVVAYDRDTEQIMAIGEEARLMLGRTPGNIVAVRPRISVRLRYRPGKVYLKSGKIPDFNTLFSLPEAPFSPLVPLKHAFRILKQKPSFIFQTDYRF